MFCQQPPHLLRPNMRLTRIKKGGHPHVTNNNKSFKNLTFSHRHDRSYPIWLPKTKKKDTSQKLMLFTKNRKIWKQVCLSRTFMMFFSDLCVKCCVIHTYSSDILMRFKEQDIKKKNNFLRIELLGTLSLQKQNGWIPEALDLSYLCLLADFTKFL